MATTEFRVYFDNEAADADRLDRIEEIRVDQAIGLAAEAQLHFPIGVDAAGLWPDIEEDFLQPLVRVRVDVKIGSGDFVGLIDGPIVTQRIELAGQPNESKLVAIVQDDSVLMNREEKVRIFEELAAEDIAAQIFGEYGFDAEVGTTSGGSGSLERVVVQRGTDMQLLRDLARQYGMVAYVRPGSDPGRSVGVFARLDAAPNGLPELLLVGPERNTNRFTAQFDALRVLSATASELRVTDKEVLRAEVERSDADPLGDEEVHDLADPKPMLLAHGREEQADLDAAAQAAVNQSSWAYSAEGEVSAEIYAGVLQPYQRIAVAGAGSQLSGDYLISEVRHVLTDQGYQQGFTLRRNARAAGGGGGLGGGVF